MRGSDVKSGSLFSYVDLEDRIPAKHPPRLIRRIVNDVTCPLRGTASLLPVEQRSLRHANTAGEFGLGQTCLATDFGDIDLRHFNLMDLGPCPVALGKIERLLEAF
ncbi:hypothetical protein [Palleronia caenipelagi]|uniref:hypothetical protein n=1 Tax=Palleronia caenipelagi TaxID=2489174 RepID=UPI00163D3EAB|nr:hypothetical protein [Palleronia caenipelagi]